MILSTVLYFSKASFSIWKVCDLVSFKLRQPQRVECRVWLCDGAHSAPGFVSLKTTDSPSTYTPPEEEGLGSHCPCFFVRSLFL